MAITDEIADLLDGWAKDTEIYPECVVVPTRYYDYLTFWSGRLMHNLVEGNIQKGPGSSVSITDVHRMLDTLNDEHAKAQKLRSKE
jgi:hypothetical protein